MLQPKGSARLRVCLTPGELTEWAHWSEHVGGSQYGNPTYIEWCCREADRISRHGVQAYVKMNGGDRIVLKRGNPLADSGVIYVPGSIAHEDFVEIFTEQLTHGARR